MLKSLKEFLYDRAVLIGRPNLTLKNAKCRNIACEKEDRFKKYKDNNYICECGYILKGELEIEVQHKMKLYCGTNKCPENKTRMDKGCITCPFIRER